MMTINTKAEPSSFDVAAEAKAAPEEPKFTLWGRDPLAEPLVLMWAERRRQGIFATPGLDRDKAKLELIQCTDAEEIAWAMRDFRLGIEAIEPEAPARERPGHAGNRMSVDELAAKKRHDTLRDGADRLHNLIAEAMEVAREIRAYGFFDEAVETEMACARLQAAADAFRPKRRGYAHLAEGGDGR
jgi:hypothetical protein